MNDLTLVSLFDGVGGFPLAFQRAGVKTVATVEIDKHCREVTAKHFPDAVQFVDVTEVSGDDLRAVGFVPERGILTGGFPCQDLSIAGRGAGLAGERSGLFFEIVRLLDELRPKWFILENVPRLLSINGGRDMGTVLGALAELGYGISWRVLDAQWFGVPQRRRRVFIVGCFGDSGTASAEVLFESEGVCGDFAQGGEEGQKATGGAGDSVESGGATVRTVGTLQSVRRGVPSTDEAAGGQLVKITHTHTHFHASGRRETQLPDRRRSRSGEPTDRVAALTATGVGTCGADDNQAQAGHLIAYAPEISPTLVGGSDNPARADSSEDGTGRGAPTIADGVGVRRLTPLECERLQGFPDNWTEGQSDSQRYRQMGNSLAIPVVEWIAHRLVRHELSEPRRAASPTPTPSQK